MAKRTFYGVLFAPVISKRLSILDATIKEQWSLLGDAAAWHGQSNAETDAMYRGSPKGNSNKQRDRQQATGNRHMAISSGQ